MALTTAQKTALKSNIISNSGVIPPGQPWSNSYVGQAVSGIPNNTDGNQTIAGWYNQNTVPAWIVWRNLQMETVLNTITFANMTPADAIPTVTSLPAAPTAAQQATYDNQIASIRSWNARSLSCQGKQFNLQNLTVGRDTAPMKLVNFRAAMQDALTNVPAGTGASLVSANWVGVRDGAKFTATFAEKVFSTGTGTNATPADLGFEGSLSGSDVDDARNS
jgi:hypothetical protein